MHVIKSNLSAQRSASGLQTQGQAHRHVVTFTSSRVRWRLGPIDMSLGHVRCLCRYQYQVHARVPALVPSRAARVASLLCMWMPGRMVVPPHVLRVHVHSAGWVGACTGTVRVDSTGRSTGERGRAPRLPRELLSKISYQLLVTLGID